MSTSPEQLRRIRFANWIAGGQVGPAPCVRVPFPTRAAARNGAVAATDRCWRCSACGQWHATPPGEAPEDSYAAAPRGRRRP